MRKQGGRRKMTAIMSPTNVVDFKSKRKVIVNKSLVEFYSDIKSFNKESEEYQKSSAKAMRDDVDD